ncbi:integrase [Bradyrhizobium yuanmingense]|uniref:Integrase n=1 Tax=Bradyrhizobium yuanmingense TaxID=108015 RepID=A0ABV4GMC6_9BRAD
MPRRGRGPYLYWRNERRKGGKAIARATWIIIDGSKHIATGSLCWRRFKSTGILARYITEKYSPVRRERLIEAIDVADVLNVYYDDTRARQANQSKLDERILRLASWWGGKTLADVNGESCRAYAAWRGSNGGARRDLEDLRAAINHHEKEGYHRGRVRVVLPEKGLPRERWLTRSEAALLVWTCWRYRETQTVHVGSLKGRKVETDKRPLRHVARFILIGLYTGTRAGAIASASPFREPGRSFVDLGSGIFYRLAIGKRATTKRQTPVPLPSRLLAHLRRWSRLGISKSHFVEWNGKPIASVKTGFASAVRLAKLDLRIGNVTPHTLRHTAATWLMQRAAPMWEAAGYLGMSEKTLRETYGHHHPDHLHGAANAISTHAAPKKNVSLVFPLAEERARRDIASQPLSLDPAGGPGRTRTCNQTVMSGRL